MLINSSVIPNTLATLHLASGSVACTGLLPTGDEVELEPLAPLSAAARIELRGGALTLLSVDQAGRLSAVKGVASCGGAPEVIRFRPIRDTGARPWQRADPRAPMVIGVRCTPHPGEGVARQSVLTVTANISASGLLLVRAGRLSPAPSWMLELLLDEPLKLPAATVRVTPTYIAVRFTDPSRAVRTRLLGVVDARLERGSPRP